MLGGGGVTQIYRNIREKAFSRNFYFNKNEAVRAEKNLNIRI